MALTSVGVIYATRSKLLQRIYIPHADDGEINRQPLLVGETLLLVPITTYRSVGVEGVQEIIGKPAHNGRCKIVHKNTGEVLNYIIADPELYRDPEGHHVILDE